MNKPRHNEGGTFNQKADFHSGKEVNFVYVRKRKNTEAVKDEMASVNLSSPWSLSDVPRRKRTQKRANGKEKSFSIPKKKLDTGIFGHCLEKLWRRISEDKRKSCAYFDCLWFSLYRSRSSKAKVLTWIKKVDIFSKQYVFVPILCWDHWTLLILCNFGESSQSTSRTRCMLLLDSLEMADPKRFEPEIRKFVLEIYKSQGRAETKDAIYRIPFLVPKVPQQRDGEACGSFVLYFISLFLQKAPENFNMDGYPYFMNKNWFTLESLDNFCEKFDSCEVLYT
ncbi:hypothetical protein L6164_014820 [Bauhinia variegata]|uniref:Uncharacterized protein n=1 Tax=Bauhinia variegata TaxID=167791 RepID=A0ACB9NNF6_BAUVA|nr:hypothetical protein L6164_014820 [Bauhinia variegata]